MNRTYKGCQIQPMPRWGIDCQHIYAEDGDEWRCTFSSGAMTKAEAKDIATKHQIAAHSGKPVSAEIAAYR